MGRLANLRIVDPILSALARGYIFPELACEALFPMVRVEKEAGKLPKFGKEAFRIYQTERALRAKSNRINPEEYGSIDVILAEHDLEYPIDYRERQEAESQQHWMNGDGPAALLIFDALLARRSAPTWRRTRPTTRPATSSPWPAATSSPTRSTPIPSASSTTAKMPSARRSVPNPTPWSSATRSGKS